MSDRQSHLDEVRKHLDRQRQLVSELESELRALERDELEGGVAWAPSGFYWAYYALGGMALGMIAAWITLGVHIVGARITGREDALELLRVYSTIIGGEETAKSREAVVLVFAIGLHTLTGIVCGTPLHVIVSRYWPDRPLVTRIAIGVVAGVVMWAINYWAVLSWLQPVLTGEEKSHIVESVPTWVAIGTHVLFCVVMLVLQPYAVFRPSAELSPQGAA